MTADSLIQPIKRGRALLEEIAHTRPAADELSVWWLGQSGYAFKTANTFIYVDLYLSEHLTAKYANTQKPHIRMTESPLRGADITDALYVFASHKHSDHLDPGTLPDLMRASPDARLVLPHALIDYASTSLHLPAERLIGMRGDDSLMLDSLAVYAIPSAHPELAYTETAGYPFLGFVFQADGVTWYHSGDTLVYDGLADRLRQYNPDLVFLPINGTDARRSTLEVPPNMNSQEALMLAAHIGHPYIVPHHYDMFTFNTADVSEFTTAADAVNQRYQVLRCGEHWQFSKSNR